MTRVDSNEVKELKYRELAEHSRELLFQQQERFVRVDNKAAVHLSALTVLFALVGFFVKWALASILPPKSPLEWAIAILCLVAVVLVLFAWFAFYRVLRHHTYAFLRLDREYIDFCRSNLRVDVNHQMAVRSAEALESLVDITHSKARWIGRGYKATLCCMVAIVLLGFGYAVHEWAARASIPTTQGKDQEMVFDDSSAKPTEDSGTPDASATPASQSGSEPESASEPDPSVTGPNNVILTEGVDISNISRRSDADSSNSTTGKKDD